MGQYGRPNLALAGLLVTYCFKIFKKCKTRLKYIGLYYSVKSSNNQRTLASVVLNGAVFSLQSCAYDDSLFPLPTADTTLLRSMSSMRVTKEVRVENSRPVTSV